MPPSRLHRQIYSPCQELVLISLPRFPPFDGMLLLCDPPIDLVDFFSQVRHPLIESFEPDEKPPLDMADGHQHTIDILLCWGFLIVRALDSLRRDPCV